jgi:hypothetical protein
MAGYKVIVASRVDRQLLTHVEFIARVSIPAARRFRDAYVRVLDDLEENPLQFPLDTDPNLPENLYHKAIFAKWYKALFLIDTDNRIVYLDAVVDCRQTTDSYEI